MIKKMFYSLLVKKSSTTTLQVESDSGVVDLKVDTINHRIEASGIKFPSTQVASTDPNTLDDYEEGTFTPSLSGSTTAPTGISYANRVGLYTKIGNVVHFSLTLSGTITGKGTGSVVVTGLPFVSKGGYFNPCSVISSYTDINSIPYVGTLTSMLAFSTRSVTAGSDLNWSNANVSATNFSMIISGTYIVE